MKNSPLLLSRYFVSDLHCSANREYDAAKPSTVAVDALGVEVTYRKDDNDPRKWQITMNVRFQPSVDQNARYVFALEVVGFFDVIESWPAETVEQVVKVNGASILFGAVREIVRTATSAGPFPNIILPSVSFYESKTQPKAPAPATAARDK